VTGRLWKSFCSPAGAAAAGECFDAVVATAVYVVGGGEGGAERSHQHVVVVVG
jgi:hypothetical protein